MIGTVFAGHRIEAQVGRGGMGVVYRARHCRLDRLAALKVIAPDLLEDATAQRRFREEAAVAASLEHPNVVPVHDAGEADGIAYLAMRYIQGTDLATLAPSVDPLAPAHAAEIVARVAGALDCLHDAGYVHRDVKPRNVLVARDGHVYLSDFGLARRVAGAAGATRAGDWVGTVDYVAPEQIRGQRVGARADVYGARLPALLRAHGPAAIRRRDARGQAVGPSARAPSGRLAAAPGAAAGAGPGRRARARQGPRGALPLGRRARARGSAGRARHRPGAREHDPAPAGGRPGGGTDGLLARPEAGSSRPDGRPGGRHLGPPPACGGR